MIKRMERSGNERMNGGLRPWPFGRGRRRSISLRPGGVSALLLLDILVLSDTGLIIRPLHSNKLFYLNCRLWPL